MSPLRTVLLAFASLAVAAVLSGSAPAATPATGDKAPLVQGKDQDGKDWKLADLLGAKIILLYFYPKDDTPGCTKEACGLRDRMDSLKKDDVVVVGVSMDSPESHRKFIAKHQLNFMLVADTDGKITQAYGAQMSAHNLSRRVSFLIGLDGKISHVTDNPDASVHLNEMKDAIGKLKK
jgi:thioredoxin-dependent peroxiredoxin